MSGFAVKVVAITNPVEDHPNADRLSVIKIGGYVCVSAKLDDGSHRYNTGDLVIYVPEGAVVPEFLLRQGFWDEDAGKGILAGPNGDRVHPLKLRGIFSQGILFPVLCDQDAPMADELVGRVYSYVTVPNTARDDGGNLIFDDGLEDIEVDVGEDVSGLLGIKKYEPPIPENLLGSVFNLFGHTLSYDFDSIQTLTDMFEPSEPVVVTEKIHGFNTQIGYVPGLNHPDCFGDGNIYLSSKGLAAQGLAFKNTTDEEEENDYTRAFRKLLAKGFGEKLAALSASYGGQAVRPLVELYGGQRGLKYGKNSGDLGVVIFDLYVGDYPNGHFLSFSELQEAAKALGIPTVPFFYEGPYDPDIIVVFRDGKDTLTNSHVREGIVIKGAEPTARHAVHGRKIVKWVSPNYLLKTTGEELS